MNYAYARVSAKDQDRYLRHRAYPALISWMSFSLQGVVTSIGYRFFRRKLKCS